MNDITATNQRIMSSISAWQSDPAIYASLILLWQLHAWIILWQRFSGRLHNRWLTVLSSLSHQRDLSPHLIGKTHQLLSCLCFRFSVWKKKKKHTDCSENMTLLITYPLKSVNKYSYEKKNSCHIMFKSSVQHRSFANFVCLGACVCLVV